MTIETQKTLFTLPLGDTSNWSVTGTESKAAFPGGPYWVEVLVTWVEQDWMVEVWGYQRKIDKFRQSLCSVSQCKTDWERLFSRVCSDSSRGSCFRPKGEGFRWDARDAAFYSEGGETLEQDSPLLKGFNARLDGALSSLISEKCHQPQYIPSNPNHSMILRENTSSKCEKQTECMQMGGDSHLSILTSSF